MKIIQLNAASMVLLLAPVFHTPAQSPVIASFSQNGELVCSNLMAGSMASVEWSSSLDGPWRTNWSALDSITVGSNGTVSVGVPMFYRVRGAAQPTHSLHPTATTTAATPITLNGTGNPNGNASYAYSSYSTVDPGTPGDIFGTRVPASSASDTAPGSGFSPVDCSRNITGLTPGTTYYCCAIVRNSY